MGRLDVWDMQGHRHVRSLRPPLPNLTDDATDLHLLNTAPTCLHMDAHAIAMGATDHRGYLWPDILDVVKEETVGGGFKDTTRVDVLVGHEGDVTAIQLVPTKAPSNLLTVLTGSADKTVRVWRRSDATHIVHCVHVLRYHGAPIYALEWHRHTDPENDKDLEDRVAHVHTPPPEGIDCHASAVTDAPECELHLTSIAKDGLRCTWRVHMSPLPEQTPNEDTNGVVTMVSAKTDEQSSFLSILTYLSSTSP